MALRAAICDTEKLKSVNKMFTEEKIKRGTYAVLISGHWALSAAVIYELSPDSQNFLL